MFSGPFFRNSYCSLPSRSIFNTILSYCHFHISSCNPFHPLQICQNKQHLRENKCYRYIKCISVVNTVTFPGSHPCETINKSLIYTISTIKCISHRIQSLLSLLFLIMIIITLCDCNWRRGFSLSWKGWLRRIIDKSHRHRMRFQMILILLWL